MTDDRDTDPRWSLTLAGGADALDEQAGPDPAAFDRSREKFEAVSGWLEGKEAGGLSHGDLEARLQVDAASCSAGSCRTTWTCGASGTRLEEVLDAQEVPRGNAEAGHTIG